MENEIWKDIQNYESLYQISSIGRVRRKKDLRILNNATDGCGYHRICLTKNSIKATLKVHRLVGQAFIPNPDNKLQINHKNGIKKDNNVDNLEWVTHTENIQHAFRTGLNIYDLEYHSNHMKELNFLRRKPVIAFEPSGKTIEFISQTEAGNYYNVRRGLISKICTGIRSDLNGIIFKFK